MYMYMPSILPSTEQYSAAMLFEVVLVLQSGWMHCLDAPV